jgi:hypothetical protein
MVEDLIKRIRRDVAIWEAGDDLQSSQPMIDAADLIEQQAARLTALEAERDALLAAAGKEAVAELVKCRDMKGSQWFDIKVFDKTLEHGTKLYTAPTAALENGDGRDADRYRFLAASAFRHLLPTAETIDAALSQKAGEQQ